MMSKMNKHVNKLRVQKQLPTKELCSKTPNMVVDPPNLLDSGVSIICPSSPCIHHQGTIPLTSCESPHLHQKQMVGTLVPIFSWVLGGQSCCKAPKHFYQQNLKHATYQNKILLNGLCGHNVQDAYVSECDYDVQHKPDVNDDVHENVEFVSQKTKTPTQND